MERKLEVLATASCGRLPEDRRVEHRPARTRRGRPTSATAAALMTLLGVVGITRHAAAVIVDFTTFPAGHVLTSEDLRETYQLEGVELEVVNGNPLRPDVAVIFDSSCPGGCTGGDPDLRTPGTGEGNTVPQGKIMIIAEDVVDADLDGRVDDPDDECCGGVISLSFPTPFKLVGVRPIDVDEPVRIELELADGGTRTVTIEVLGDNSAATVAFADPLAADVIRFRFDGSGGLDNIAMIQACGDGVVDAGEACDPPGSVALGGSCSDTCTFIPVDCGNGTIEPEEQCDPPATQGGDRVCRDDCTRAMCGDGQTEAGEECDPPATHGGESTCNDDCVFSICGDAVVEAGEDCDPPGVTVGRAVCDDACRLVSTACGDSTVGLGEQCDPPASQGGDPRCNDDCSLSTCGDSVVGAGEQCDPPVSSGGLASCADDCTLARCGDGEMSASEECDPPTSQRGSEICADDCTIAVCGDDETEAGEQCDPPDGDTCSEDCELLASCGNGVLEPGEECDPPSAEICDNDLDDDADGLVDCADDDCDSDGTPTCNASCLEVACVAILRDPAQIRFNEPGEPGFLTLHGRFSLLPVLFDPSLAGLVFTIRNDAGPIHRASLLPGDLEALSKRRFRYKNAAARHGDASRDGVYSAAVRFRRFHKQWFFAFRLRVYADLSRATEPRMTAHVYAGPHVGFLTAEWTRTRRGWRLRPSDFARP
jgi:hypothetical protein